MKRTAIWRNALLALLFVGLWPVLPRAEGAAGFDAPITLDLRDTELREVCRVLGVHLSRRILVDPSVARLKVSAHFENVPIRSVLASLAEKYALAIAARGDTLLVGPEGISPGKFKGEETRAFTVVYVDPAVMKDFLIRTMSLSPDNVALAPRLRSIYVTAAPETMDDIAAAVAKRDYPPRQIRFCVRALAFSEAASSDVREALERVYKRWWFVYTDMHGAGSSSHFSDVRSGMTDTWRVFDVVFENMALEGRAKIATRRAATVPQEHVAVIGLSEDGGEKMSSPNSVGPRLLLNSTIGRDGVLTVGVRVDVGEVAPESDNRLSPSDSWRFAEKKRIIRVRDGEPFLIFGTALKGWGLRQPDRGPYLVPLPLLDDLFPPGQDDGKKRTALLVVPEIVPDPGD